jgi:catalase
MNGSFIKMQRIAAGAALLAAGALWAGAASGAEGQEGGGEAAADKSLAQQIFDTMLQVPGTKAGYRLVHAKGVVCQGTFAPSKDAATLSKAAHFQGASVPITVRFSDGAPDPSIPDSSPGAGPRGMAIRFKLPDGGETDIVALSHNGFIVGTGEDFLALQKAIVATDPSKPHPWPIEAFIAAHPLALKFVQEIQVAPASGTQPFFPTTHSFP